MLSLRSAIYLILYLFLTNNVSRFFSENILKPNLEKKKTVPIPDVDDFDDKVMELYLYDMEIILWFMNDNIDIYISWISSSAWEIYVLMYMLK